jgi:alpha-amylase
VALISVVPGRTIAARLAVLLALAAGCVQAAPPPGSVIYEIYVRAFQDSDGDGIGDLDGATSRLDYLEWLGVTDLWLMPINPSPSEHGYDPTDYLDVESDYGTLADMRELLAAADERGIRVILDLVVNHTSDRHPWFLASAAGDQRFRDYYVWRAEPPAWQGLSAGSPWHRRGGSHYLALFDGSQPDLNHRNPEVRRRIFDAARFWLELGVAGFRVDAIQHIVEGEQGAIRNTAETFAWVREFERFVEAAAPSAYLLGETWMSTPLIARYHLDAGLDMSTNYPLWDALVSGVQARSPATVRAVLEQDERLYPPGATRGPFLSNHDQMRPATRFGFLRSDPARLRLAAALLMTMPGVPILYYGEEIGMPNGSGDDDRYKRTPMRWSESGFAGFSSTAPWHDFSTDDPSVSVFAQRDDQASLLSWYRFLIGLRRSSPALHSGTLTLLEGGPPAVLAFLRSHGDERVLVLANFSARPVEVLLEPLGFTGATDLVSGVSLGDRVEIPGTSAALLNLP